MKNKLIIFFSIIMILLIGIIILKNDKNDNQKPTKEEEQMIQDREDFSNVIPEEYVKKLDDGLEIVESEKLTNEIKINNLVVKNIKITSKEKMLSISLNIINTSDITQKNKEITIVAKNKKGVEIGKLALQIDEIKGKEKKSYVLKPGYSFINTYEIEVLDKALSL